MTIVQRTNQGALIGELVLRQDTHRAYWRGVPVELTFSEFTIVCGLATQSGDDVTYENIYELLYGSGFVGGFGISGYRSNVRSYIKRIRKKFRAVDPEFDRIENYPKCGYRWRDKAG